MGFFFASMPDPAPEAGVPTLPLRTHLARLGKAMDQAEQMLHRLVANGDSRQSEYLYLLDNFIFEGLADHMAAEECVLLPLADELAVDASIVLALRISANNVRGLAAAFHTQASLPDRDLAQLRETGQGTLRVARAHFAVEESTLLPAFDIRLSLKDVERRLERPMAAHTRAVKPMNHKASAHHMEKYHRHGQN